MKRLINEITSSRTALYSSWFPDMNESNYNKLVIKQGSEYTSMGDLFTKKFKNPVVLGLDHPKMAVFYDLNHGKHLPVVYCKPKYV